MCVCVCVRVLCNPLPPRYDRSYYPMAYSVSDEYTAPLFDHVNGLGHGDTLTMVRARTTASKSKRPSAAISGISWAKKAPKLAAHPLLEYPILIVVLLPHSPPAKSSRSRRTFGSTT